MHWKTRGRFAGTAILCLSFIAANASTGTNRAFVVAETGDPVIDYVEQDARMNAAQDVARSHLPAFLDLVLDDDGYARPDAAVKVAVPVSAGHEVIWVTPFGVQHGHFVGALANAPNAMDGLSKGDVITFNQSQVRDWYFFGPDGRMFGSFTTRVMLDDLPADQAAQIAGILSEAPVPAQWRP